MELNHSFPNIELRSEDVQELMGTIPPVILRIGTSVILCFFILIYIASIYIEYPEIIAIPIVARNVNGVTEINALKSGVLVELNMKQGQVHKGDVLAKIVVNYTDVVDTICVKTPFTGIIYPCYNFQEKDYVEKNDILCVVVDSINNIITAKASVSADLKKKLIPGMKIISNFDDVSLEGKVLSIADFANPINGTYIITMIFANSKELENRIIWKHHTIAKVKVAEYSVFDKFFRDRIIPSF